MLIGQEKIEALLPHGPGMRLIDQIIRFDHESMVATTWRHLDVDNPLKRSCGMLPISSGIEFAGQVTALHGALIDSDKPSSPKRGFLVMARDVSWQVVRLDEIRTELEIHVIVISRNEQSAMYQFCMKGGTYLQLMTGRIAIYFQGETT